MNWLCCGHCGQTSTGREDCPDCGDADATVSIALPVDISTNPRGEEVSWLMSQINLPGMHVDIRFKTHGSVVGIRCPRGLRETITDQVQDYLNIACSPPFEVPEAARQVYPSYSADRLALITDAARACQYELNAAWLSDRDTEVPRQMFHFAAVDHVIRHQDASTLPEVVNAVRTQLRRLMS